MCRSLIVQYSSRGCSINEHCLSHSRSFLHNSTLITPGDGSVHPDLNGLSFLPHFSYYRPSCTANQGASRSVEASEPPFNPPQLSPLSSQATTAQKSQPPLRCLNQKIQRKKSEGRLALEELELQAQLFKA